MVETSRPTDVLSLRALVVSWSSAALGMGLALPMVALGQAVGSWLGGCTIIGVCLPAHQQVWALVNQPEIAFAASSAAHGYWWGGSLISLMVAALAIPLIPKGRGWAAEMAVIQLAWAAAVIGCAWQPMLDPLDGHPGRWFTLHELPDEMIWLVPWLAAMAGLVPTVRLLALARAGCISFGPRRRLMVVAMHLGMPLAAWLALTAYLGGAIIPIASLAACWPIVLALLTAWVGSPRPSVRRLEPATGRGALVILLSAGALWALSWYCGRPLPGGETRAVLWSAGTMTNNIRPWMRTTAILDE